MKKSKDACQSVLFLSVKISTIVLSTCWQIEYIGLLVKSIFKLLLKFCSLTHKDNHYIYGRTTSYIIELVKQTLILLDHIYNHQSQTCRDGSGYQEILISGLDPGVWDQVGLDLSFIVPKTDNSIKIKIKYNGHR